MTQYKPTRGFLTKRLSSWQRMFALLATVGLCASPVSAQVITGTVLGVVSDPSGALLAGVRVTVHNTKTDIDTKAKTNQSGEYVVPLLPTGTYDVSMEADGFKTYRQVGVTVGVDEKVRIDARMEVGTVNESIQVEAGDLSLQTDASDLSSAVSQPVLRELPNVGRTPLRYAGIIAGVTPRPGFNNLNNVPMGEDSRRAFSDFTVNGGRPGGTEILLDGAPNTSGAFNEIAVLPNNDSVGEFKMITNAYSAEFGRAGTGVVQMITKSGTNQFHGAAYEYFRNSALNANTFGNNYYGLKKGVFNLHQFGGTFSGPVLLPHYNGRSKTFFFVSFEGNRLARDASNFLTVPTQLERTGDFSQSKVLRNGVLVPVNIYNPLPSAAKLTAAGNGVIRDQFRSGGVMNRIPVSLLNPVSLKLLQALPLPNRTSPAGDGTNNFFYSASEKISTEQMIAKIDHQFNERHRLTFRYTQDWSLNTVPNPYADTIPQAWSGMPTTQNNPTAALMYVWSVSPTSLLELRANVTRINLQKLPDGGFNTNLSALGFSPDMVATARYNDYPLISLGSGYAPIGHGSFDARNNHSTNPSTNGSFTKIMNKVTLKFGGEYRIYMNNFSQPNITSFAFAPATAMTTQCSGNGCAPVPGTVAQGSPLAAFLVGAMDGSADTASGQYATGDFPIALSAKYAALYTQNDWKVNQRLTLNLGLRWDYSGNLRERYDRLSQFDFSAKNITGTPGQYTFLNFNGNSAGRKNDSYKDFSPRVGFAYRPFADTVIRSAYGISYDPVTGTGSGILGFGADGFRALSFLRIRPNSGDFALLDVLDRPYNNAYAGGGTPLGKDPTNPGFLGYNAIAVQRQEGGIPYMQQWNFTLEHRLPKDIDLQVAYVGTKGTHLLVNFTEINGTNSLSPALLEQWRQNYQATGINPANTRVPNPFYVAPPGTPLIGSGNPNVAGATITQLQLNRPYPAYPSVRLGYQRYGSSSYNGLQISARRPFRNHFEVGGTYTWSKMIDTTTDNSAGAGNTGAASNGSFSLNNMKLDRAVSQFDVPHRAVIYTVWESPFGKGGSLLANNAIASAALGGWKLSTNTQFQSGLPLGISGGGFGRPDLVGDPVLPEEYRCYGPQTCKLPDGRTVFVAAGRQLYFNPYAFRNRVFQFGPGAGSNAGRYADDIYWYGTSPRLLPNLRGWGVNNTDISMSRSFNLKEKWSFVLRADVVNIFNQKNFSDSGIDKGFGSSSYLPSSPTDASQVSRAGQSLNANFGTLDVRSQGISARYIQLGARIVF